MPYQVTTITLNPCPVIHRQATSVTTRGMDSYCPKWSTLISAYILAIYSLCKKKVTGMHSNGYTKESFVMGVKIMVYTGK